MLSVVASKAKVAAGGVLLLLVLALVSPSSGYAAGSGSWGPPGVVAAVLGSYYDTGATIKEAVPADAGFQTIQISDQRRLHVDMLVEVDSEQMWITALTETNPTNPFDTTTPDTMTVDRAQNGTTLASHSLNAKVNAKVARVNIMVNDLTTPIADCDNDELYYSGADLAEDIDDVQTSVPITGQGLLAVDQHIMIADEEMTIVSLDGTDMGVLRAQNGTQAAEHSSGTRVYIKTATPTPRQQCGLGSYQINLQYDQTKARYISLVNGSFLTSTGRSIVDATGTCAAPNNSVPGTVSMQCNSSGIDGQGKPIIGALGSGTLATALFEPLAVGITLTNLDLTGSLLLDIKGTVLSGVTLNSGILQAMTCPDADNDGWVTVLDAVKIAQNWGDTGLNSGATIAAAVDGSQTTIGISGLGSLVAGDTVAVDFEQMHVNSVDAGPPATMEVQRGVNPPPGGKTHQAGTIIYRAFDGPDVGTVAGYTEPRDTAPRVYGALPPDGSLSILDAVAAAKVGIVITTKCP
jgi:hypothetical protein